MSIDAALAAARSDAIHCANEAHAGTGWRKSPAQSPVVASLIPDRPRADLLAILKAWNDAYQTRILHLNASL